VGWTVLVVRVVVRLDVGLLLVALVAELQRWGFVVVVALGVWVG
jgi:hypothetical protein